MTPSKTDLHNGNYTYPNNAAENSTPQRTDDLQNRIGNDRSGDPNETANNRLQQSPRVPPTLLPFLSSLGLPRGDATNTLSVVQQRKRTTDDMIDEALNIINGNHDDEEGESLANGNLSNTFPRQ